MPAPLRRAAQTLVHGEEQGDEGEDARADDEQLQHAIHVTDATAGR
jgi:hypothetical protein